MKWDKAVDPFYKSPAWRSLRRTVLERDHYICADCLAAKARGEMIRPRTAVMVHHIKPITKYPELRLDADNCVSLCDPCHNKRHPERNRHEKTPDISVPGVRIIKV